MLASTSPRVSVRKTSTARGKDHRSSSAQQGSVSSLPAYSELYSPREAAVDELRIIERERESDEDREGEQQEGGGGGGGRAHTQAGGGSTTSSTTLLPSTSIESSNIPSSATTPYSSYHLSSPRPQPPPPLTLLPLPLPSHVSLLEQPSTTTSSSSDDDDDYGSFESPVTQLDRLLLRSSSALATAQTLLSGTLTARGSLLDLDERGREGEDSMSRMDVETRLRTRRDSELYTTRIDPLFSSISLLLSDLERQTTPYVSAFAPHPLRTRLSAVGTSLGTVQQVDASYIPSSNSSPHQRTNSHTSNLPSSPNGGPDTSSATQPNQPPPQSPATSLLSSLHGRTSSVSSGKSFFLSPPPPSSPISRFAFPTPASSPPTQTRFPSTGSSSSSTSASKDRTPVPSSRDRTPTTAIFSSPPQPRSSHPTPSLDPSPSLDRMVTSPFSSTSLESPTRSRTVSTSGATPFASSSNSSKSLSLQIPTPSASSSSLNSCSSDALLSSTPTSTLRTQRSLSPLPTSLRSTPPSSFRTSASPSPTPVSAATTPTMSAVSLPSTSNSTPTPEKKGGEMGSAVLGTESVAMARLRSLGALKPPSGVGGVEGSTTTSVGEGTEEAGAGAGGTAKKWGAVGGWFGS